MPANILSLPPEILCRIFLHLSQESPCDFGLASEPLRSSAPDYHSTSVYSSLETQERFGWILPVMQTSRTWRRAALADPELWATNLCSFRSKEATECFLQRCKGFDKLIFASKARGESRITEHQVQLAEENIARVKTFEQNPNGFISASFAKALSVAPLPNLCVLRMCRWPWARDALVVDDMSLRAPALQELYLDCVFFTIDAPNLRTLDIRKQQSWIPGIVPASLLLSTLRATPILEHLSLTHPVFAHDQSLDDSGEHLPIHDASVELPRLRSLFFDTSNKVPHFYQRVSAAPSADVQIVNDYDPAKLAATFAVTERHTRSSQYDTLVVYEDHPSYLHVCMRSSATNRTRLAENGEISMDNPSFRFDTRGGRNVSFLLVLQRLLPHIDLSRIAFLDLGQVGGLSYAPINVDDLRDVLARFTSVTTVQLSVEARRGHIGAICGGGEGQTTTVDSPLPALQHVVVQGIVFSGMESFKDSLRAWGSILDVLGKRKRDGQPVRFLTLCDELMLEDAVDVKEYWSDEYGTPDEILAKMKRHEQNGMLRAAELVEKVFDARGWGRSELHNVKWMKGRITEFVQEL